jgi:hypothetical protein
VRGAAARHNDAVSPHEERLAKNEALFREVNERIQEIDERLDGAPSDTGALYEFICECADEACFERVQLLRPEYEQVRRVGTHFVVAPGHARADIERVVEHHERYHVVEKISANAARVAAETNPRG